MKTKEFILDFHLFDGEGGEGGGDAASATSSEQGKATIQYGKAPEGEGHASQVGSDNGDQAQDLEAEFAALIGKGGKFHELYGQKVSETIQGRFRNQADLQGQVDQISDGLSPLFMNYGLESGDFEGLIDAVSKDDAFYQAGAEKAGLDIDQYKENLKLKADSERLRKIEENYERERAKQETFRRWEAEAAELQKTFPNFDLGLEIENYPAFGDYIDKGASVRDAFMLTHMNDILGGVNAQAQTEATENVVSAIKSRAARPVEGGIQHAQAVQRKSDPKSLTEEDLDEINRQVKEEGKSFRF